MIMEYKMPIGHSQVCVSVEMTLGCKRAQEHKNNCVGVAGCNWMVSSLRTDKQEVPLLEQLHR